MGVFLNKIFKRLYLFIYFQREGKGEKEWERNTDVGLPLPTGDLACKPGICPDWESNQQLFGLQAALSPLSHTRQDIHGCCNEEMKVY